jgi:hypothetical protein
MARNSRTRTSWIVICLLALFSAAASASPQVRSTDNGIAALIAEAQSRSPTFRDLVRRIERTDGIVYVERGRCGHGVHACLTHSVVAGENFRLLRILVDGFGGVIELMATIGHELQHAIELLTEHGVRSTTAALLYYLREAPTARDSFSAFETDAAVRAGLAIERELR